MRARNNLGETIDWVAVTPLEELPAPVARQADAGLPAQRRVASVGDDFYFQWTPVEHATRYQLDVSTDPNFSTFVSCFTPQTTYAAGYFDLLAYKCTPGQGAVTYWRVRALDEPANVQGIYSSDRHVRLLVDGRPAASPRRRARRSRIPTLTWQAAHDAEKYRVTLTDGTGKTVTADTYSLSWTPKTTALDPAEGPFGWTVQSIDANGSVSPKYPNWTLLRSSPVAGQASVAGPVDAGSGCGRDDALPRP